MPWQRPGEAVSHVTTADVEIPTEGISVELARLIDEYAALSAECVPTAFKDGVRVYARTHAWRVLTHPLFDRMCIEGCAIHILTTHVHVERGGWRYDVGVYAIELRPLVKVYTYTNITRTIDGYHGPHINAQGVPCFAGKAEMADACMQGRLDVACCTLLDFLMGFGPGSAYTEYSRWPTKRIGKEKP